MTMTHKEALRLAIDGWFGPEVSEYIGAPEKENYAADMEAALRAYIKARGLVLVPKEATEKMLDEVTAADQLEPFSDMTMSGIYRQMLAAASDPFGDE